MLPTPFYTQALLCCIIFFVFLVDFHFFNSRNTKKIIEWILEVKKECDDCFATFFLLLICSFTVSYYVQMIKIIPAVETFIVYMQLRFLFDNCGNTKRWVLLFLYLLSVTTAVFHNSNLLVEICFLLLGWSLWKNKKNGEYTLPELLLLAIIIYVIFLIDSDQNLPTSLFDFLKNSNSYCVGENEQNDSIKKVFSQEIITRVGGITILAVSFFVSFNII
jgi:hypothetical protein